MVCSGNICRSPFAELLLRAQLKSWVPVEVSSAGTVADVGEPMTQEMRRISREMGLDPETQRSSYLSQEHIAKSDLILTMSREHRRFVVQMDPRKSARTFTLREFARLGQNLSAEEVAELGGGRSWPNRLLELSKVVASQRWMDGSAEVGKDDVVDPYRRSNATYLQSVAQIVPAVEITARLLNGIADT